MRQDYDSKWRSILVGKRIGPSDAMWLAVRDIVSSRHLNYIPVREGRGARRISLSAERRMRFLVLRRSAINLGLCEHELTIVQTSKRMDRESELNSNNASRNHNTDESCYRSKLPHRIVPCEFESKFIYMMLSEITNVQKSRGSKWWTYWWYQAAKRRFLNLRFATDVRQVRFNSCQLWDGEELHVSKTACLVPHSVSWYLTDYCIWPRMPRCQTVVYCDGRDGAIFAATREVVYSLELMDAWLFAVAVNGATFREAYASSKMLSTLASVRYFRWGSFELRRNRRAASSAFASFLRLIEYPAESRLSKVFSCLSCEHKDADGMHTTYDKGLPVCSAPVYMYNFRSFGTHPGVVESLTNSATTCTLSFLQSHPHALVPFLLGSSDRHEREHNLRANFTNTCSSKKLLCTT